MNVSVRIQVCRVHAERAKALDLSAPFAFDFACRDISNGVAREFAVRVHKTRYRFGRQSRPPVGQLQMYTDAALQLASRARQSLGRARNTDHRRGRRDAAAAHRSEDTVTDALTETEVVRIDDQSHVLDDSGTTL